MFEIFDDFIIRAIIAGVIIACVTGVIGCFVVWRKMAYFGDSLSHSSLLGIALGFVLGISPNFGVIISCLLFAFFLIYLQQKHILATDTLLGILAHSALSFGMVVLSIIDVNINIHGYLFGDILTILNQEIYMILIGSIFVLILLYIYWQPLVLMTISDDIAKAEGLKTLYLKILLTFLMTLVVALSIRIFGILLITSMLIIPAASARQISKSPSSMALFSVIFGIISVVIGILLSIYLDSPSGPTIVAFAVIIFTILSIIKKIIRN